MRQRKDKFKEIENRIKNNIKRAKISKEERYILLGLLSAMKDVKEGRYTILTKAQPKVRK